MQCFRSGAFTLTVKMFVFASFLVKTLMSFVWKVRVTFLQCPLMVFEIQSCVRFSYIHMTYIMCWELKVFWPIRQSSLKTLNNGKKIRTVWYSSSTTLQVPEVHLKWLWRKTPGKVQGSLRIQPTKRWRGRGEPDLKQIYCIFYEL